MFHARSIRIGARCADAQGTRDGVWRMQYKGGCAGREAVQAVVSLHPSRSLARAVIGV